MTSSEHKQYLQSFMQELSEDRFYDAHESLEKLWFPRRFEDNSEIKLIKGFINAAVSFELAKKGRHEASNKVWKNYIKYISLLDGLESPHVKEYHLIAEHISSIRRGK